MTRGRVAALALGFGAVLVTAVLNKDALVNGLGWALVGPPQTLDQGVWPVSSPAQEGVDPRILAQGYAQIRATGLDTHALVLVRNGKIVDETYFAPFQAADKVNIYSCTKSLLGLLVGVAIHEGKIRNVDQSIWDFFPRPTAHPSPAKDRITVRHLLTMSAGLAVKHPDEVLRGQGDWVQAVLDLPMAEEPGTRFRYADATAHLLSALLSRAVGMDTADYARSRLLAPLGIDADWPRDPQGLGYGFSGVRMTARDLAMVGLLCLNQGVWEGRSLVPASWIHEATSPQVETGRDNRYGYLWWCPPNGFQAVGLGEQILEVIPLFNLVLVATNSLAEGQSLDLDPFHRALAPGPLEASPEADQALARAKGGLCLPGPGSLAAAGSRHGPFPEGTFTFPPNNPYQVDRVILSREPDETVRFALVLGDGTTRTLVLTTDGRFSPVRSGIFPPDAAYARGFWVDRTTFRIRIEKGEYEQIDLRLGTGTLTADSHSRGQPRIVGLVGTQVP